MRIVSLPRSNFQVERFANSSIPVLRKFSNKSPIHTLSVERYNCNVDILNIQWPLAIIFNVKHVTWFQRATVMFLFWCRSSYFLNTWSPYLLLHGRRCARVLYAIRRRISMEEMMRTRVGLHGCDIPGKATYLDFVTQAIISKVFWTGNPSIFDTTTRAVQLFLLAVVLSLDGR